MKNRIQQKMTASEMIDEVKKITKTSSDYALEKQLGLKPSSIQQLRKHGGNTAPWKLLNAILATKTFCNNPDPWVRGWMLGKYDIPGTWPGKDDKDEWLEGFKVGLTEVGEYEQWQERLREKAPAEVLGFLGL